MTLGSCKCIQSVPWFWYSMGESAVWTSKQKHHQLFINSTHLCWSLLHFIDSKIQLLLCLFVSHLNVSEVRCSEKPGSLWTYLLLPVHDHQHFQSECQWLEGKFQGQELRFFQEIFLHQYTWKPRRQYCMRKTQMTEIWDREWFTRLRIKYEMF